MNAFLFPGQGSQVVGMGQTLYEESPKAKALLDEANEILNFDLKKLMFEGPQETLTDTKYAQPAIYVCSAMYLEKAKEKGIEYSYVAGHSLGEYDALYAAGLFSFSEGLELVARRGEAMSRMNGRGTMAAVLGMEEEQLSEMLPEGVVMANLNTKSQIVISGTIEGIEQVKQALEGRENIKCKQLSVSAAFHSPQMAEAAEIMKPLIEQVTFEAPDCYVVSNVTGQPTKDPEEIKRNLIAQITGQVRWCDSVLAMKEAGVETLYEVGYGDILKKMNKAITFRPKCIGIDD